MENNNDLQQFQDEAVISKLHACLFHHLMNCDMKKTASTLLEESRFLPFMKSSSPTPITNVTTQRVVYNNDVQPLPVKEYSQGPLYPDLYIESLVNGESLSGKEKVSNEPIQPQSRPILQPKFVQSKLYTAAPHSSVAERSPPSIPRVINSDLPKKVDFEDNKPESPSQTPTTVKTLFGCRHSGCKSSFTTLANMKRHERLHSGERPFACELESCGKRFARKYDLKIHMRIHTKEKPYTCLYDSCGKQFSRISSLREHERNVHSLDIKSDSDETKRFLAESPKQPTSPLPTTYGKVFMNSPYFASGLAASQLQNSNQQLMSSNEINNLTQNINLPEEVPPNHEMWEDLLNFDPTHQIPFSGTNPNFDLPYGFQNTPK